MSFGGGMASGLSVGLGAGMVIGISAGEQRARSQLREYVASHELTLHDREGRPVDIEDVLTASAPTISATNQPWGAIAVAVFLALLLGIGVFAVLTYVAAT